MTETSEFGQFDRHVVVIGGCGHVGLPLAIAFADRGARVGIYDVSEAAVQRVNAAQLPFDEPGASGCWSRPLVGLGRPRTLTSRRLRGMTSGCTTLTSSSRPT